MEIGLLCTQEDSIHRPTMPDVLQMLSSYGKLPTPTRYKVPRKISRTEKLLFVMLCILSFLLLYMGFKETLEEILEEYIFDDEEL